MNDLINARCGWAGTDELYVKYHDEEWGKPVDDDRILFEFLVLESAQAGLSWITILRKREGYRKAFHRFDPERVEQMTPEFSLPGWPARAKIYSPGASLLVATTRLPAASAFPTYCHVGTSPETISLTGVQ